MKVQTTVLVVLGVASALLAGYQTVQAQQCYGAFVLRNPTNVAIHYQIQWGNGEWQSYCVQPGWSKYHYYPLDANGQVPPPQVRFDHIAGDNHTTYKTYSVGVYSTHYPAQGKKYAFRYSACGCYLNLYSE